MRREFSIYLDLVRFIAALLVFIHHLNLRWISIELLPFGRLADLAVMAFFVMSGFVISYVTHERETSWRKYFASRASRIYSVVIPVLVVVPILDLAGRNLGGDIYKNVPHELGALRIAISMLFLNQTWGQQVLPFSDSPFWSVCYEVWYYAIFGIVIFANGWRRIVGIALACLLSGPAIILLFPVWILGILLYKVSNEIHITTKLATILAASGATLVVLYEYLGMRPALTGLMSNIIPSNITNYLIFSKEFIADWTLGTLIFLHFLGMSRVQGCIGSVLLRFESAIRKIAGYTFQLYLFHQPLLYFWATVIKPNPSSYYSALIIAVLVLASVYAIGGPTEKLHKYLKLNLLNFSDRAEHKI